MPSPLFEVYVAQARNMNVRSEDNDATRPVRLAHFNHAHELAEGIIEKMLADAPDLAERHTLCIGDGPDPEGIRTPFYEGPLSVGFAVRRTAWPRSDSPGEQGVTAYSLLTDADARRERIGHGIAHEGVYADMGVYASMDVRVRPPERAQYRAISYPGIGDLAVHGHGYNEKADLEVISFLEIVKTGVDQQIAELG